MADQLTQLTSCAQQECPVWSELQNSWYSLIATQASKATFFMQIEQYMNNIFFFFFV